MWSQVTSLILFPSTEPPTLLALFDFTNLTLPRNFLTNKSIWSRILKSHDTYHINFYYSSGTTKWPDTCGSLKFKQPICWARCNCISIETVKIRLWQPWDCLKCDQFKLDTASVSYLLAVDKKHKLVGPGPVLHIGNSSVHVAHTVCVFRAVFRLLTPLRAGLTPPPRGVSATASAAPLIERQEGGWLTSN